MFFKKRKAEPSAEEVANRLVILKYVVGYALTAPPREVLGTMAMSWSPAERAEFARKGLAARDAFWRPVRDAGLWRAMSPWERAFAASTAATMTLQQQINGSWRLEAVQPLGWALGLFPAVAPFDVQIDGALLQEIPSDLARAPRLRDPGELERERSLAELWHWRSRTRQLIERGDVFQPHEPMKALGLHSFDDIVRMTAREAAKEGRIPPPIDEDFPVRGKAYRDLSAEEWSEVESIATERHFALNWVCGYAPKNRWDDTPTDT